MDDEQLKRDRLHVFIEGTKAVEAGLAELRSAVPDGHDWEDIKDLLSAGIRLGFEAGWSGGIRKFYADRATDRPAED